MQTLANTDSQLGWTAFFLVVYMLPTVVAFGRKAPHKGSILVINFFGGWTFIGWVVALAMACRSIEKQHARP
jgi:hypothetical protein